jgi:hypothetical protein
LQIISSIVAAKETRGIARIKLWLFRPHTKGH